MSTTTHRCTLNGQTLAVEIDDAEFLAAIASPPGRRALLLRAVEKVAWARYGQGRLAAEVGDPDRLWWVPAPVVSLASAATAEHHNETWRDRSPLF